MSIQISKMTCVLAMNLLSDALFVNGKTYDCYRNMDTKKVFVVDALGAHIEVKSGVTGVNGESVWGCDGYHFTRNF